MNIGHRPFDIMRYSSFRYFLCDFCQFVLILTNLELAGFDPPKKNTKFNAPFTETKLLIRQQINLHSGRAIEGDISDVRTPKTCKMWQIY